MGVNIRNLVKSRRIITASSRIRLMFGFRDVLKTMLIFSGTRENTELDMYFDLVDERDCTIPVIYSVLYDSVLRLHHNHTSITVRHNIRLFQSHYNNVCYTCTMSNCVCKLYTVISVTISVVKKKKKTLNT